MNARITDILAKKRDAKPLRDDEIADFVQGVADSSVSDAQIAAFAMAVVICGMRDEETIALTRAMRDSGEVLDWSGQDGPILDKHSSGGIGDKVSLVLAPILAACGAYVPMISGRGLGHTGGTLDKLESFVGYSVDTDTAGLRHCLQTAGCAIVGANADLAPADGRIYAVRDLTATVESLPLITASILSKKLAAGPDALVMDVKVGSGAFCRTMHEAEALAQSIVSVGNGAGLQTRALVSDMNQCLGRTAGNALEVEEALAVLQGQGGDPRLLELIGELASTALVMGGLSANKEIGASQVDEALRSGRAMERFAKMAVALGARSLALPVGASVVCDIPAPRQGVVQQIDAKAIGLAVIDLGGGRTIAGEAIDHRVGFSDLIQIGETSDRPLGKVHARSLDDAEKAIRALQEAIEIGEDEIDPPPLVHGRIDT